jgi:hypothetical protein
MPNRNTKFKPGQRIFTFDNYGYRMNGTVTDTAQGMIEITWTDGKTMWVRDFEYSTLHFHQKTNKRHDNTHFPQTQPRSGSL